MSVAVQFSAIPACEQVWIRFPKRVLEVGAANWADKVRVWFKPPGWRPADVAQRFPKPPFEIALVRRFHPEVTLGGDSTRILCEMIGAVDAQALGKQVAHLGLEEMRGVDDALQLVLGLR